MAFVHPGIVPYPAVAASATARTVTAIRHDLRRLLRREATAPAGGEAHRDAIAQLLALHGEMVTHPTFASGQVLRQWRTRLQSRLIRVARDMTRDTPFKADSTKPPATVGRRLPASDGRVTSLAQQLGGALPGDPPAGADRGNAAGPTAGITRLPDFGPDLAELIRRVVLPEFWDVRGGPGTVVYYASRQVLVVRATSDVHDRLRSFLMDMRAAGGP
jgi:hypothetical protein